MSDNSTLVPNNPTNIIQEPPAKESKFSNPKFNQMKYPALFVGIGFLLAAGIWILGRYYNDTTPPIKHVPAPKEIKVQGTVVENYLGCHVDGLCYLTLQLFDDSEIKVTYHYGEFPPCKNTGSTFRAGLLENGDNVQVFGKTDSAGDISTCDSTEYYIKKIDQQGDVTKEFSAKIIGSYNSPGESSKVAVSGNIVYLTDTSEGLLAIDVSDPTKPKLLDSFKIGGGGAYAISMSGATFQPHLLVGGYGNSKVEALEITYSSGKWNLQPLKESNAKRSAQEIVSLIDYIYFLAIDGPEFEVYDALTGESRTIPGTPGGHILDFAIANGSSGVAAVWIPMLLAAQGEKGIAIFRVDGLSQKDPELAEVLTLEGYTYAVDVDENNKGYALSGNDLVVIDIEPSGDAKILIPRGRLSLSGGSADLDVTNSIAAIAMRDKGVTFIDVSDPDNLRELGIVDTPGRARDVELVYDSRKNIYYAYVADDRDDLQIIEVRRQNFSQ